jgi:hypothetical protein
VKREPVVEKSQPAREVMPMTAKAELAILATESGRQRLVKTSQPTKSSSGILVICDGGHPKLPDL